MDEDGSISVDLNSIDWNTVKLRSILRYIITTTTRYIDKRRLMPLSRGRLQKICYFCDANHYLKYFTSISGCLYVRGKDGPVPVFFDTVMKQLITDDIVVKNGPNGYKACEFTCNSEMLPKICYDYIGMTIEEKDTINSVLQRYLFDINLLSIDSSKDIPCSVARDGQVIDLNYFYYNICNSEGDDIDDSE